MKHSIELYFKVWAGNMYCGTLLYIPAWNLHSFIPRGKAKSIMSHLPITKLLSYKQLKLERIL